MIAALASFIIAIDMGVQPIYYKTRMIAVTIAFMIAGYLTKYYHSKV